MKKLSLFLVIVLTAVMLGGCGGNSGSTTATASGAATASAASGKKILNICRQVELSDMDSSIATESESLTAIVCVIEPLYVTNPEDKPVPGIAESYEVSKDGKTYTFHLRKNANWTNGEPVTANDFVFSWRRLADPKTASEYSYMVDSAAIKNSSAVIAGQMPTDKLGVYAKDDKTLVVELDRPIPYFISLVSFPIFCPINQKFCEEKGDKYAVGIENLLCCGPFVMSSWDVGGNTYSFTKNPKYYDPDKVKVDQVNIQVIKDNQQAVLSYENGDTDFTPIAGDLITKYQNNPGFKSVESCFLWYISANINPKSDKFRTGLQNLNLRKAIALSYDKDAICKDILKDGSIPANFAIPRKLAFGPDGKDFRDTSESYLTADKQKAKEYWEKAKKELGTDTVNIEFLYDDSEATPLIAQFIQNEVETNLPGVKITLKAQPKKSRLDLMRNREFELGFTRWGPDYSDPMTFLDMWETGSSYNYGEWSSPEYDSLLKQATTGDLANDPAKRWEALKRAESLVMNDAVILPVYQKGMSFLLRPGLTGIPLYTVNVCNYAFAVYDK
ncbi:MAG: peptide ABC transporter substrate-binding protein [Bacillota bacterium]|nr:peptide ABC transporter substrate-binding protein [Bacillota bacterium]